MGCDQSAVYRYMPHPVGSHASRERSETIESAFDRAYAPGSSERRRLAQRHALSNAWRNQLCGGELCGWAIRKRVRFGQAVGMGGIAASQRLLRRAKLALGRY